jgi:hypothetical protein
LLVSAPDMPDLRVPLNETQTNIKIQTTIWGIIFPNLTFNSLSDLTNIFILHIAGDKCDSVQVLTAEGNQWFCDFLGTSGLTLVRMAEGFVRNTEAEFAPNGMFDIRK